MAVFENQRRGNRGKRWGISYRDLAGKVHQRIVSNDKKVAEREYRQVLDELERGLHRPDARRVRFADCASTWLRNKHGNVRPATWRAYRTHVQRYLLKPDLGLASLRLRQVDLPRLREFKAALSADAIGLKPKTVNAILTTLGAVLDQARVDGYLYVNPARDLQKLPVPHQEMDYLRPDEVQPLFAEARDMDADLYAAIVLSIFAGLRRSELLALRYDDLEDRGEAPQLSVKRTYQGRGRFGEPKTDRSRRRVNLANFAVQVLREHRLRYGNPPGEALIFDRGDGWPIDPDHLSTTLWKRLLRRAGMRQSVRWHDLRHTYATLMLAQGVSIAVIKGQLGHSSIQQTVDRYAHLLPATCQDAAAKLEDAVFGGGAVDKELTIAGRQA